MLSLVAALRYGLGEDHVFEFVEGAFTCPQAPGKPRSAHPNRIRIDSATIWLLRSLC